MRDTFADADMNEVWAAHTLLDHEQLAQIDALEPDPANWKQAVANERLRPFWCAS